MIRRRLTMALTLAVLVTTFGASAVFAQSPNAGCVGHIASGLEPPGQAQRVVLVPRFGQVVSFVAHWEGSSLEECIPAIPPAQ